MKTGSGKNSTTAIMIRAFVPVEKFLVSHPWTGWIAFFMVLGIFGFFMIWQYVCKSRLTTRAISQIKNACDTDSVTEKLISASDALSRMNNLGTEYHKISSDNESPSLSESLRSTPSYLFTGVHNTQATRLPISRRKDSFVGLPTSAKPITFTPMRPREALRQIYPSDISSVGSESSRSYSRPLSYREMRRSTPNSPTVISPYSGF